MVDEGGSHWRPPRRPCNAEIVREYAKNLYEPHLHFPTTAIEKAKHEHPQEIGSCVHLPPSCVAALHFGHRGGARSKPEQNGAAGQMPAFYDGTLITVNMKEMPAGASPALIAHNRSINTIYATNDLDEEQDFIPVIDAIQGDGFNPLWQQVLIHFNEGFAPHQFPSDEEVLAAAAAAGNHSRRDGRGVPLFSCWSWPEEALIASHNEPARLARGGQVPAAPSAFGHHARSGLRGSKARNRGVLVDQKQSPCRRGVRHRLLRHGIESTREMWTSPLPYSSRVQQPAAPSQATSDRKEPCYLARDRIRPGCR